MEFNVDKLFVFYAFMVIYSDGPRLAAEKDGGGWGWETREVHKKRLVKNKLQNRTNDSRRKLELL